VKAENLAGYVAAHPAVAGVAITAVFAAALLARRLLRGRQAEDVLTLVAAVMAQAVVMNGMWRFAGNVLHFSGAERYSLFAFLEICVVACAFRARRNMKKFNKAGTEGTAVWVLSALSGTFAALDARSFVEALFRLATPLVAAWMWHRAISLERRERTGRATHWRMTAERVLVWLGLAEPAARETGDVAAHRRVARLARAAKQVRRARAGSWRRRLALWRLERRLEAAVEHADLATDPARQGQMLAQIGALNAAESLASLKSAAPWEPVPDAEAPPTLDEVRREISETVAERLALESAWQQDPAAAGYIGASLGALRGQLPELAPPVAETPRQLEPEPWPEAPAAVAAAWLPDPDREAFLADLDRVTAERQLPPGPEPAAAPSAEPAARPSRKQPARTKPAAKGSQAAAAPKDGDPPAAVIRAAASAQQLAAETGISRWRAQQLVRPGSYAMRQLHAVNGNAREEQG